jgi:hypothetical protein
LPLCLRARKKGGISSVLARSAGKDELPDECNVNVEKNIV